MKHSVVSRLSVLLLTLPLLLGITSCTTTGQNPFSGKALVQFDQGQFFVLYLEASKAYVVAKSKLVEMRDNKQIDDATWTKLVAADTKIQRIDDEILYSLQNPAYPVDMAKVSAFVKEVMGVLVQAGVKGITSGAL